MPAAPPAPPRRHRRSLPHAVAGGLALVSVTAAPGPLAPSAARAQEITDLRMEVNVERFDGATEPRCVSMEVGVDGSALEPVTMTPSGGPATVVPPDGPDSWNFDTECFASLAGLEAAFPLDAHDYAFDFANGADATAVSFSSVSAPSCFADITSPAHLSAPATTPTLAWTLGCAADCYFAFLEDTTDDEEDAFVFDCPASGGTLAAPPLDAGHVYRFSVEPFNEALAFPTTEVLGQSHPYWNGATNLTTVVFTVPEPPTAAALPAGAALLAALARRRRASAQRRAPEGRGGVLAGRAGEI